MCHLKTDMLTFECSASAGSHSPWWSVDLAVNREIVSVRIFNRRDDAPEWSKLLDNFTVHVGSAGNRRDPICAEEILAPAWGRLAKDGGPQEYLDVPCTAAGRFLTIVLPGVCMYECTYVCT